MAHGERQLHLGSRYKGLCQAIGAQAGHYASDKTATQRHDQEFRESAEAGLRKTARAAGLTNSDCAAAQMVRLLQFISPS